MSNATCTADHLREEDHLREVRVVHQKHMSNPRADRIKGLGQVHKEDVQALILFAAFSLICRTANIMSIVPLFFLKAQGLSDTKSSKRSCVIQLSMMSAMRFPEILNGEMPLWLSYDALSFLFLYRWMALVFLKSSGRYLIRNRCFPSLELLIFFLGFLQCWGIVKRA